MDKGSVYLVHLDKPLGHNRHYMGFSRNVEKRLERHRRGNGAKLLAAAKNEGIGFRLVRVWENVTPSFERKLKLRKEGPRFCPVCNERAAFYATGGSVVIKEEF